MTSAIRLPPLLALRAFESSARHLSFTEAGNELHLTQGAISRQIKMLESFLGVKLFERYTRRIELTEAGQEFYAAVQESLLLLEKATRSAMRDRHRIITLNVLPTLNSLWLMPRLSSFNAAHPDIELRLISSINPIDFVSENVDVGIRVGRLPGRSYDSNRPRIELEMTKDWRDIHAHYLFPDVLVPVISRRLLAQRGPIEQPADLLKYRLIHTASRKYAWVDWLKNHGLPVPAKNDALEFGHFFMALGGARDCKGVAIVPKIFIEMMPQETELICPLPADVESAGAYYLLTRESQAGNASLRVLKTWLLHEASTLVDASRRTGRAEPA